MPYFDTGDVTLFYTDEGPAQEQADEPLVFVHGFSCDSHDWSWQLPHFVARHRVIAVDLRGHGRSSAPEAGYTAPQFAADVAALLDHLSLGPVVAFGHSMGGSVVSALAVEHAHQVQALVAVDPAYLLPDETVTAMQPLLDLLADSPDPVPLIQELIGGLTSPALPPALRTWHLRRLAGTAPHALRQSLSAQVTGPALRSQSEPFLRKRHCPVLSFYADPDRGPLETATFSDARSRVVTWEGAGHWLHQERPEDFASVVDAWLASIRG